MAGILTAAVASTFSGVTADPYFEYTTLLLPGNGTNGAQNNTFLDGSTNNFTITRNGNTTQGTFSPFSQTGWGNYFDGTGDYLSVASNAAFNLSTNAFCVETWFYPTVSTGQIVTWSVSSTGIEINLSSGTVTLDLGSGSTWFISAANCGTAVLNAWNHIAIVKNSSGNIGAFLNGNRNYSTTNTTAIGNANTFISIGANRGASNYFTGYFSNFRYVNGSSVYDPTQTTLTVPTAPLTAITNTSLLTCQSNRFIDNSTNNFTITRNGDTRVVAFSPFNPTASWSAATYGGSGYFDGSGDWINPNTTSANLALGSGDFTIEFWLYTPRGATRQYICDFRNNGSTGTISPMTAPALIWGDNGADANGNWFRYLALSNGSVVASADLLGVTLSTLSDQWNHIAVVRSSGTVYGYLNGVRKNSVADSTNYNVNCSVSVASFANGTISLYLGYISNFRVVKGTAVYTGTTYTVPTAPLTAISNTSLLLNFTNAGIYDATSKNDLETVGNAQISTAISAKWGSGSMYFDGTGDWLLSPASTLYAFNTGDFTIEGWVYIGATPANACLFDTRNGFGTGGFGVFVTNGTGIAIYTSSGTTIFTATSCLTTSTWQHLAITRNGTNFRVFVNGTQISSTVTNSANMSDGYLIIANALAADRNYPFTGYIQDLRITKGYARYTANFTAPTAAFPTL